MRDLLFHQRLLQLDARGRDGHGIPLAINQVVVILGNQRSDEVRQRLAGTNLCFANTHRLFGKALIHVLCEHDLFLSHVVSVFGKNYTEDGVDHLEGALCKCATVSRVARVLNGRKNMRHQAAVSLFLDVLARKLANHNRSAFGIHIECDVYECTCQLAMVNQKATFKGEVVCCVLVNLTAVLICLQSICVVKSHFKHCFVLLCFRMWINGRMLHRSRNSCAVFLPSIKKIDSSCSLYCSSPQ